MNMRRLSKLRPTELSLVRNGANKRRVTVIKSDKEASDMDAKAQQSALEALRGQDPSLLALIAKAVKDRQDAQEFTPQAAQVIKAVGRMLAPFAKELTLSDLAAVGRAAGLAQQPASEDESLNEELPVVKARNGKGGDAAMKDDDKESADADKKADAVPSDKEDADSEKKKPKSEDKKSSDKTEKRGFPVEEKEVEKSARSADAQYEQVMKAHKETLAQNAALMEEIKKHRKDANDAREYQVLEAVRKTVKSDLPNITCDVEELAPALKMLRELPDQSCYETILKTLKSADEKIIGAQRAGGIYREVGKSSDNKSATGMGSASDRIDAEVDRLCVAKSAEGKAVNRARVYDEFINATPEGRKLYAQYHNEERV